MIQYNLYMGISSIVPLPQPQLRLAEITVITGYRYPCKTLHRWGKNTILLGVFAVLTFCHGRPLFPPGIWLTDPCGIRLLLRIEIGITQACRWISFHWLPLSPVFDKPASRRFDYLLCHCVFGCRSRIVYVDITICTYMKTLWCSNYDQ